METLLIINPAARAGRVRSSWGAVEHDLRVSLSRYRSIWTSAPGQAAELAEANAGQYDQSLHFHSSHFQVISEGGFKYTDLATAPMVTTVNVKRASTAMVLFTLTQAGTYPVHVHTAQMETGNGVYLNGTATLIIGR